MLLSPLFFLGVHQPCDLKHVGLACVSINRLRVRKAPLDEPDAWIMDSGGFTEVSTHGLYRTEPEQYASEAARWVSPRLLAIVAQDYMCEPFILRKTGLTVADHQRLTIERYDRLAAEWSRLAAGRDWPPIMPVLQGWAVNDYLTHLNAYGDRLAHGAWVGVGSVCKRQGNVPLVEEIFWRLAQRRPDLRFHAFGLKLTALRSIIVRALIYSADSMAWSFSARKQGRNGNCIQEGLAFAAKVDAL